MYYLRECCKIKGITNTTVVKLQKVLTVTMCSKYEAGELKKIHGGFRTLIEIYVLHYTKSVNF